MLLVLGSGIGFMLKEPHGDIADAFQMVKGSGLMGI